MTRVTDSLTSNNHVWQGFPQGAIDFMRDIYTAFKSNDTTKNLLVYGIALGKTYGGTSLVKELTTS